MNILFICKFNRFRSKIAEALFKHYVKRKDIEVKSAGLMIDIMRPFVAQSVMEIMNHRNLLIPDPKSQQIDDYIIKWADKIIIVADNCPLQGLPAHKVEIWPIGDASEHDHASILMRINEIEKYVQTFANRLNVKK